MLRHHILQCIIVGLTINLFESAPFFDCPWLQRAERMGKSSSQTSLKSSGDSKETPSKPGCTLTIKLPSQESIQTGRSQSPKVYIPSRPIPIPCSPKESESAKLERSLRKSKEQLNEDSESDVSTPRNSFDEPLIFEMSHNPRQISSENLKKVIRAQRKKQKKLEKLEKKKLKKSSTSTSTEFDYYCTGETDSDVEEFSGLRSRSSRLNVYEAVEESNSEVDSDFDGSPSKRECWSLSF